jgi:heterodisulfide reductase subunit B
MKSRGISGREKMRNSGARPETSDSSKSLKERQTLRLGYYPGCTLTKHATAREFGGAITAVADAVGMELVELPDWNCCGATAAHSTDPVLAVQLPGRNLRLAEQAGFEELVAPCAACSSRLLAARQALTDSG